MQSIAQCKETVARGGLDKTFERLYGAAQIEVQRGRYLALLSDFEARYGADRAVTLLSAPGRTEIGGNHTDHNRGCVLAAAVQLDIIAAVSPTDDGRVRLKSAGFDEDRVDLGDLTVRETGYGQSASLIRGVAAAFVKKGFAIGGFDACTTSDVLKGSGISSSAAFEVLVAAVFNHLYNAGRISHVDEAKAGQYAENVFFGKPSGLMDQMASAVGGFVGIDFENPDDPQIFPVQFDFDATGHSLCVVDTGGSHVDLTDEYAAIRAEMESVARFLGAPALRQADENRFYAELPAVRTACGDRAVLRAMHFFADTRRAVEERTALQNGDFETFKRLLIESGRSSYMYNQNAYAVSDPAHQGICIALALSERLLDGKGAWRLQGGGFGGTIQAFVPRELLDGYRAEMDAVFGEGSCKILRIRPDGSRVVD